MICLIALEALLILFAAPLPVSVRLHVSDERSYAAASVSLFGARLVTARAEIAKDRVRMRINGKNAEEFRTKKPRVGRDGIMRAAKAVRRAKLVKSGSFSLCVGAADCADGAMLWGACAAVLSMLPKGAKRRVHWDRESARFALDAAVGIRVSLFQAAALTFALLRKP